MYPTVEGQVINLDNFDEHRAKFEEKADVETPYQSRRYKIDKPDVNGNRWVFPLVLLLIVFVASGAIWFLGSRNMIGLPGWFESIFTFEEENVQITMPEALFAGQNLEEASARAVEEQGVIEVIPGVDDTLIYTMTAEVRSNLLIEAENQLKDKLAAINDQAEHPEIVSISSDSSYKDFYLVVALDRENRALVTASELFMLAVYYHYLNDADPVREVSVIVEDIESGDTVERLVYPDDLNRAAAIIEDPAALVEEPAAPQPGDKVVVRTGPDNLNLRNGPEITYLIIDILSSGTVLEVTGSEGLWLEVITPEGMEGWVHGDFVELYDD